MPTQSREDTQTPAPPAPKIDSHTAEFWRRLGDGSFELQRCKECGRYRYPPRNHCPGCLANEFDWVKATGSGTVYTYITYERAFHPAFAAAVPYTVALVELDEKVRVWARMSDGVSDNDVTIGSQVELVVEQRTAGELPCFTLVAP